MLKEFPKDFVTLYTDATLSSDGHHAYAFWAKAEWGTIRLAKMCPDEIVGIGQAELYAICQGMYKVLSMWKSHNIKGFYVRSDSKHALNRIQFPDNKKTSKGKDIPAVELRLMAAFKNMRGELQMNIKHVKGHTGRSNVKAYLNDWCDKQSRAVIKEHRKISSNK